MCIIYVIANISKLIKVKIEKSVKSTILFLRKRKESTILNLTIIFYRK